MILGIITARGGSKGITNKNIQDLAGKPLIQWVMETAKQSKELDELIMSTDSQEMADIALDTGVVVPFIRPTELAGDRSLVVDVLKHALEYYKDQGKQFDYVALIQPTSPFTKTEDIDNAVSLAKYKDADTIISGYRGDQTHPSIMFERYPDQSIKWFMDESTKMVNRQDLKSIWLRSGNIYVIKADLILNRLIYGEKIFSIEIPKERAFSIDNQLDLEFARFLADKRNYGKK